MNASIDLLRPKCAAQSIGTANSAVTNLLQTLLTAYCQISLSSSKWPPNYGSHYIKKGSEAFDYIIVGGGTAGSVVAGRLSENPHLRILLIEAGDNPPLETEIPGYLGTMFNTEVDWNYTLISNKESCLDFDDGRCPWRRGKMLGGSSSMSGMIFARGNRRDFDTWESMGNPTWGWDNVFKYYKKTEDYQSPDKFNNHGVGGPLVVNRSDNLRNVTQVIIQAAKENGYEYVDEFRDGHFLGYGMLNTLLANASRISPAKAFLQTSKPNLQIIKNAIVTKINFDDKKQARSVSFDYKDENDNLHHLQAKTSKEIIICAGAIESPKLLMLSGIGPRKHLRSLNIPVISNLAVGANLQDHLAIPFYFKFNSPPVQDIQDATFDYFIHRTGLLAGGDIIYLSAFLDIRNETGQYPTIQLHHLLFSKGSSVGGYLTSNGLKRTLRDVLKNSSVLGMSIGLLNPKSRGCIKLASADYREKPLINPNYLSHKDDIKLCVEAIKTIFRMQFAPAYRQNGLTHFKVDLPACESYIFGSDAYWECYVKHIAYVLQHTVGTVKMGPDSDRKAVVDYKLRVKGVKGLRVADASIMPKTVSGNPMATTTMIGERVADFIKEDWKYQH